MLHDVHRVVREEIRRGMDSIGDMEAVDEQVLERRRNEPGNSDRS